MEGPCAVTKSKRVCNECLGDEKRYYQPPLTYKHSGHCPTGFIYALPRAVLKQHPVRTDRSASRRKRKAYEQECGKGGSFSRTVGTSASGPVIPKQQHVSTMKQQGMVLWLTMTLGNITMRGIRQEGVPAATPGAGIPGSIPHPVLHYCACNMPHSGIALLFLVHRKIPQPCSPIP